MAHVRRATRSTVRRLVAACTIALLGACRGPTDLPPGGPPGPQTVVLLATPKILPDFAHPDTAIARFLDAYAPLTARAAKVIVVFAVGNSEHILTYHGRAFENDTVQWAHYIDGKPAPGFTQTMRYTHLATITAAFHRQAAARNVTLQVFDQVDPGDEFTWEFFKFNTHPECMDLTWRSYDVRARLKAEARPYASAPDGIVAGTSCGTFLVDQVNAYVRDLGFDGIFYGNQLGTRGRWLPDNGPGYTDAEAAAIRDFLAYSRRVYAEKGLIWFDSYNNARVEHDTFSFPSDGYQYFDYVLAAGFCVVSNSDRYLDDLKSKLQLSGAPRVLATLDYVDPWYTYDSMTDFPGESAELESIAIHYRDRIAGLFLFANDETGAPVPKRIVESFSARFFAAR